MTEQYILSRLTRIGATLAKINNYLYTVTQQDGTKHNFASRDAAYKYYFERKFGDEKKEGRKVKKYVR